MEIDLQKIKELSKEKNEENWRFRTFLKRRCSSKEIDHLVHEIFKKISQEIDCSKCGNCCKVLSPTLEEKDIKRLSNHLKICPEEFAKQYLIKDEESGKLKIKGKPCPFLQNNICTVERYKPQQCREYPYLQKRDFTTRLINVIDNYAICPIVFNLYEDLKDKILPQRNFKDF